MAIVYGPSSLPTASPLSKTHIMDQVEINIIICDLTGRDKRDNELVGAGRTVSSRSGPLSAQQTGKTSRNQELHQILSRSQDCIKYIGTSKVVRVLC